MGFYVPWAIEHSSHPARLARRMSQQQLGAGSGVDRPADLKVQALNTPGNGFRVAAGGGIAQSRDTTSSSRESYGTINDAEIEVLGVPGTGSGQTRRDLVILEITDPEMESVTYPEPTDPEYTGGWQLGDSFCRITVIPGVASGVKSLDQITTGPYANVTGVTLAAINWLPSTSTIGNGAVPTAGLAAIEDLRVVHSPEEKTAWRAFGISGAAQSLTSAVAYPGGQTFPAAAVDDGGLYIPIPDWATQATIVSTLSGVTVPGGANNVLGRVWVQVGSDADPDVFRTEPTMWDIATGVGRHRVTLVTADTVPIPASMRGLERRFYPRGNKTSGPNGESLVADSGTSVVMQVTFREVAV